MVASALFVAFFLVAVVGAYPSLIQPDSSRRSLSGTNVITPIGIAQGTVPINGTSRFAVKYARAQRWQNAQVADIWELPYASSVEQAWLSLMFFCSNGSSDPRNLPLACPQSILEPSQYSEDCLSMLLYVPSPATISTELPIFLWFVFNSTRNVVSNSSQDPWGLLHTGLSNCARFRWHPPRPSDQRYSCRCAVSPWRCTSGGYFSVVDT
jgi:hypothetical protein